MKLNLIEKKAEQPGVYTFVFKPSENISWQPGQYMHYVFNHPDIDERGAERWFTISSAPYEKTINITTRFDGELQSSFKKSLLNLPVGGQIDGDGPKGDFVLGDSDKHYILIAGGIGVTPFHSMLAQMAHDNRPVKATLMYANRDQNFVFDSELESYAQKYPSFKIKKYVGDQRIGDDELQELIKQPDTIFYVSGPKPMVEAYYNRLFELGAPEDRVKKDFFPGY